MAIDDTTILKYIITAIITFVVGMASWLVKNTWGRISDLEKKNEKRKDEIANLKLQMTKEFATKTDIQRLEEHTIKRFDDLEKLLIQAIQKKD